MNLSHLHSMWRWEFLTISIEEASAQKKAVSFHSMNSNTGGFPIAGVQAVQIRFRWPEEHFLATKHEHSLLSLPDRIV
jgi:hypothetical protein